MAASLILTDGRTYWIDDSSADDVARVLGRGQQTGAWPLLELRRDGTDKPGNRVFLNPAQVVVVNR